MFSLHTTKKSERDMLLDKRGKLISIDPQLFQGTHHKAIVCEEGSERYYEHSPKEFFELLKEIEKDPKYDYTQSAYYKTWIPFGSDINTRLSRLPELFQSIKEHGIKEPVQCEVTGERLNGSYRSKIALYLGIKRIPAALYQFKWNQIDESFIERKLKARWLSSGKDYYEFEYGYKNWKNIPEGGEIYRENAERAGIIVPLIKGNTVLDIGCNEGYISIQAAKAGKKVVGIDIDFIHIAWLNKLVFEWIDKKDLKVKFFDENALDTKRIADTILMLNVLYHLPRDKQKEFVMKFKGKQIIFQCNLRKEHERENYYTSHPDDLKKLLDECEIKYEMIEWRDKPIIITL